MYLYRPKPIILPLDLGVFRTVPELSSLSELDKKSFDSTTVFFDVFMDPSRQILRALGPRLLNLKRKILPLHVFVNGCPIKFRLFEVDRLIFFETEPLLQDSNGQISIRFEFKTFNQTIKLNHSDTTLYDQGYGNARLIISTLQKDNHLQWIDESFPFEVILRL